MKKKDYAMSIVLHGFIGYLWVLFATHAFRLTAEFDYGDFISIILILVGSFFFGAIIKRITPYDQYKMDHPIKLVGFVSLLLVVAINITLFNSF